MYYHITAASLHHQHTCSKMPVNSITLGQGLGIIKNRHNQATSKHQPDSAQDQGIVYLSSQEFIDELNGQNFDLSAGCLGENITTEGIDLTALPADTKLLIGMTAIVQLTALRSPCPSVDQRLKKRTAAPSANQTTKSHQDQLISKAGVLGRVIRAGRVIAGDAIMIEYPHHPWQPLTQI